LDLQRALAQYAVFLPQKLHCPPWLLVF
jgi:hypothetical protein